MVFWKDFFFWFFLKKLHQRRTPGEISGSNLKQRFSGRGCFREKCHTYEKIPLQGDFVWGDSAWGDSAWGDFAAGRFCCGEILPRGDFAGEILPEIIMYMHTEFQLQKVQL